MTRPCEVRGSGGGPLPRFFDTSLLLLDLDFRFSQIEKDCRTSNLVVTEARGGTRLWRAGPRTPVEHEEEASAPNLPPCAPTPRARKETTTRGTNR